jgi:hypothetical protein
MNDCTEASLVRQRHSVLLTYFLLMTMSPHTSIPIRVETSKTLPLLRVWSLKMPLKGITNLTSHHCSCYARRPRVAPETTRKMAMRIQVPIKATMILPIMA